MGRLLLATAASLAALAAAAEPMTKEQGDAILQELRLMRQALERAVQPPPPPQAMPADNTPVEVRVKDAMAMGKADAPLTMVAFVDYECPFCRRFDVETFPRVKKEWIDTGRLRYVVRDLPLAFHPRAQKASEASHCAAEQGKYWEMRDVLVQNQQKLDPDSLVAHAKGLGLAEAPFRKCLDEGRHAAPVKASLEEAKKLGVSGTPTFVIGRTGGNALKGVKVIGALPYAEFERRLKEQLGG
ncbi:MAG TPA: thioredoxin domain-containing protein [Usitatibacteraceae bacterium]|jgi:protein-disulfide isomerase|nr:thioredoxin domain-containing protein [Usitatibacteraceae bacterium]HQY47019.1 thioredoxin domain-containing protein [Usitatibacteraceae bacterium]HRA22790.1 thioredoxin domain-containing protein [Usitatibacteraceae bacterium]